MLVNLPPESFHSQTLCAGLLWSSSGPAATSLVRVLATEVPSRSVGQSRENVLKLAQQFRFRDNTSFVKCHIPRVGMLFAQSGWRLELRMLRVKGEGITSWGVMHAETNMCCLYLLGHVADV